MISALPAIYIEYKDLSKVTHVAEIQKDIIVQFVKSLTKDNNIIIERASLLDNSNENEQNFIIRCLQCTINPVHENEIIFSSLTKTKNTFTNQYTFDIRTEKNKRTTWRLEVIEKKRIHFFTAKQNISPNTILSTNEIEISSCTTEDFKCNPKSYFFSKQDAENNIYKVKNKRTNFPIRQGKEIDILNLSQDILVRAGEKIKIIYSPSNTLTIQTYGKSLSNGGLGERIRVQISNWFENSSVPHPNGIIEGTVVASGEVEYATK